MSAVTTHVLDAATGSPAAGVVVVLERSTDDGWEQVAAATTDGDGRCRSLGPDAGPGMPHGTYRLTFATGDWFTAADRETFYPYVVVTFTLDPDRAHHHVPLLLSPFAYSTYRGS
ncbi:hydroxyisourate hydrolase [Aquipuribacter sp. MA13-6]|uniref:hydroxyisourate hydrolase n=1 Tax=unclassified Aquipuribacter TaxID=2635084 RepID=UPI003EEF9AF4